MADNTQQGTSPAQPATPLPILININTSASSTIRKGEEGGAISGTRGR